MRIKVFFLYMKRALVGRKYQQKYQRGFTYSTTVIIKLYITTVILQFNKEESSGFNHI